MPEHSRHFEAIDDGVAINFGGDLRRAHSCDRHAARRFDVVDELLFIRAAAFRERHRDALKWRRHRTAARQNSSLTEDHRRVDASPDRHGDWMSAAKAAL